MNATADDSYKHSDYDVRSVDLYAQEKYRLLWTEVLLRRRFGRALDLGCGSGDVSLLLSAACDEVLSVDPDAAAVRRTRQLVGGAGLENVCVAQGDLGHLDPGGRFDLIVAFDVLEHIEDDVAAIDRLAQLLAPGGVLFVTVPAGAYLFGSHDVRLGHFRRYERSELARKLGARFEVERCVYFGASLVPVAFALSRVLRREYPVPRTGDVGPVARLLRRILRAEARRDDLPCGTSLIARCRSREAGPDEPRPRWPKVVPAQSEARRRFAEEFIPGWLEALPRRFALIEAFNHGYPARTAPAGFRRTLELGPGAGEHLARERLTAEQRRGYFMLELRESMCQLLRARHPDANVVQGDCQRRLDFPDDHFDRVVAIHVLEHLPDLPAALREAWRVCDKARGVLQVVIPCEGGLAYGLARRLSAQRLYEARFGVSYGPFIEREHLNRPDEVLEALDPWFEVVERSFFPFEVPSVHLNLVIGLTLRPRPTPPGRAP